MCRLSDFTFTFHFPALEKEMNPRDGGAWWAAVYGVTQSWTRLKRLSSSSSASICIDFLEIYVLSTITFIFQGEVKWRLRGDDYFSL